jgi:hypothetical protein
VGIELSTGVQEVYSVPLDSSTALYIYYPIKLKYSEMQHLFSVDPQSGDSVQILSCSQWCIRGFRSSRMRHCVTG